MKKKCIMALIIGAAFLAQGCGYEEGTDAVVTVVDSTPTPHSPPSSTASIFPSISSKTCSAHVGLGFPELLAEGAANGTPAARIIACAAGWDGKRTATVESPALTSSGMHSAFGRMIVMGPGQ